MKKLIVVLGAHRSGTSLCAAAVECLGARLGLDSRYRNEENEKGFFEHPEIVGFNDRLLSFLGGSWDNPLFDGPSALAQADLQPWRKEAEALFESIYRDIPVAAVKDPRMCQLLGFWLPVFEACGYERADLFLVHIFRNPVEVALSQQSRALGNPAFYELGRNIAEGASLWLSLTAQSLAQSRGLNNYFLSYHDLLADPERTIEQLASFLQVEPESRQVRAFCEDFVDPSLHRSVCEPASAALLAEQYPQLLEFDRALRKLEINGLDVEGEIAAVLAIFHRPDTQRMVIAASVPALSRLSEGCRASRLAMARSEELQKDLQQRLDEHRVNNREIVDEYSSLTAELTREVTALQQRLADQCAAADRLQARLSEQDTRIAQLQQLNNDVRNRVAARDEELAGMRKSVSWRLTRPLRWIRRSQIQGREFLSGKWVRFRVRSILIYHRMSLQHPRLAWILRRTLRPFFRFMNRLLVTGPIVTPERDTNILLAPMLYQQYERGGDFAPLVSVIVPNYNHAPFLELRLNSIFSQTYQNIEVILLDDASTDGSEAVLGRFHQRYPEKSRLILNESNSGGVFHQWEKGLQLARGEIIWIAESDDWCSENFLETLVQFFENEAVQLAHCRTVFTDDSGREEIWSINEYLHDLDRERWNHTILETGHRIVAEAFAIKNIIPNVSSAIFRNPRQLEILKDPEWKRMRTCGDWLLYLHLIRGGMLAYSPAACSYYRMHGDNTSVKSYADDQFYIEHEMVARAARQYFRVDDDVFLRQKRILAAHWRENRESYTDAAFDACYSLDRIRQSRSPPAPNLLMASYAFTVGGGETFPIQLANVMKAAGYNVTYLDCAREPRNEGIRQNLRPDIPIVSDFSQLERIVTDFGIDIIHSHHAWVDSTILDVLPERTPCSTVVTLHGMYETINDYDLRTILPRLVKRSARLIYVAEKNLTALRDHKLIDKASLVRIDNALSPDAFDEVDRASLGIPAESFVLSLVSRALADKGWEEAIASVRLAREMSGHDIHLLLVGDGPEYERLLEEELPEYVHLQGFQRNVRGYFAMADVGYLPSRFKGESFPLVIIECLQSGRPFLASNLGEVACMLDGTEGMAGILVDLNGDCLQIEQLAREISRLASDAEFYQLLRSRVPAAARKFDPGVLTEKYDTVYRDVMTENRA